MTNRRVIEKLVRLRGQQRDTQRALHAKVCRELELESAHLAMLLQAYEHQLDGERERLLASYEVASTELSFARLADRRRTIDACRLGLRRLREACRMQKSAVERAEVELARAERREETAREEARKVETSMERRLLEDFVSVRFGGGR